MKKLIILLLFPVLGFCETPDEIVRRVTAQVKASKYIGQDGWWYNADDTWCLECNGMTRQQAVQWVLDRKNPTQSGGSPGTVVPTVVTNPQWVRVPGYNVVQTPTGRIITPAQCAAGPGVIKGG